MKLALADAADDELVLPGQKLMNVGFGEARGGGFLRIRALLFVNTAPTNENRSLNGLFSFVGFGLYVIDRVTVANICVEPENRHKTRLTSF